MASRAAEDGAPTAIGRLRRGNDYHLSDYPVIALWVGHGARESNIVIEVKERANSPPCRRPAMSLTGSTDYQDRVGRIERAARNQGLDNSRSYRTQPRGRSRRRSRRRRFLYPCGRQFCFCAHKWLTWKPRRTILAGTKPPLSAHRMKPSGS